MDTIKGYTSIIFTSYDLTQTCRQITMKSLENIFKYTDDEDYEIIWVDTQPKKTFGKVYLNPAYMVLFGFDKRENRKRIIIEGTDPGQYACYNRGAKEAKGEYLCFFQNDVFVPEGWLKDLRWHLDSNPSLQAVFPDQWPENREFVKESYKLSYDEAKDKGSRDAGILFIRRSVFDAIGGWNESIRTHFGEKDMYGKLSNFVVTCKPMITHLEHAVGWERAHLDWENYSNDTTVSAMITQGLKP